MPSYTLTWLKWTKYVSGFTYGDSRQLSVMTANGTKYGRYGFAYDNDLIDFMQFCRSTSTYYDAFIPFINMGVGNYQLVNNQQLQSLLVTFTNENPVHFGWCQDQFFYNTYLKPVVQNALNAGLTYADYWKISGTLSSFALRNGVNGTYTNNAISAMLPYDTNVNQMLVYGYTVFINAFAGTDGSRWYTQWTECRDADFLDTNEIDIDEPAKPVQPTPPVPPVPPPSTSNFWHLWFDLGLFNDY